MELVSAHMWVNTLMNIKGFFWKCLMNFRGRDPMLTTPTHLLEWHMCYGLGVPWEPLGRIRYHTQKEMEFQNWMLPISSRSQFIAMAHSLGRFISLVRARRQNSFYLFGFLPWGFSSITREGWELSHSNYFLTRLIDHEETWKYTMEVVGVMCSWMHE